MTSGQQNHVLSISQRPAEVDDQAFLYDLYCSTRSEEIDAWGLDDSQREMILKLQFTARERHYDLAFPEADHRIILCEDRPIGRILVYRSANETRLVDVALLPDHRGTGIGSALVRELCNEASVADRPLTLHVAKTNPAVQLYKRLGFSISGDIGTDYKMEWRSPK